MAKNKADILWPKIVKDSVHGDIELSPVCIAVMDTMEFQRLRFIKQLGFTYFVYPGAAHNRFEHCIGTCHLAGVLVRTLQSKQSELEITEKDVMCVELAGLLHDIGHGPISHLFQDEFIRKLRTDRTDWEHEDASLDIIQYIFIDKKKNPLLGHKAFKGFNEDDVGFIKAMIRPGKKKEWSDAVKARVGKKPFLLEIISNEKTKVDVDKWDYFARDCHNLGIPSNFEHLRYVKFVRALEYDKEIRLCCRDKEVANLYQMFQTRRYLHRFAYKHKVTCAINFMMIDAMIKADPFLKFTGKDGKQKKMSESIDDVEAYCQMTDNVMWQILQHSSEDDDMKEAKELLKRILERDLYNCLAEWRLPQNLQEDLNILKDEIKGSIQDWQDSKLFFQDVFLNFGDRNNNPLDNLTVYTKHEPNTATKLRESVMDSPTHIQEILLRIYIRDSRRDRDEEKTKKLRSSLQDAWERALEKLTNKERPEDQTDPMEVDNRPVTE